MPSGSSLYSVRSATTRSGAAGVAAARAAAGTTARTAARSTRGRDGGGRMGILPPEGAGPRTAGAIYLDPAPGGKRPRPLVPRARLVDIFAAMVARSLHLAVDLGAGSGRAMVGRVDPSGLVLRETHRFHYRPVFAKGHLRWDFERLLEGVRAGIRC